MTDEQLRAIVRDAIVRHLGSAAATFDTAPGSSYPAPSREAHASHAMFRLTSGRDTGGACVIEPAVACTHCGYCKSYGH